MAGLVGFSAAGIKHSDQKQFVGGRGLFQLAPPCHSSSLEEIRAKGQEESSGGHRGMLLTDLLPG